MQKQTLCNSGTISSDKTSFNKNSRFSVWNVIQTQLHNNLNIMKFGEENNTKRISFLYKLVDIFCCYYSIGYIEGLYFQTVTNYIEHRECILDFYSFMHNLEWKLLARSCDLLHNYYYYYAHDTAAMYSYICILWAIKYKYLFCNWFAIYN